MTLSRLSSRAAPWFSLQYLPAGLQEAIRPLRWCVIAHRALICMKELHGASIRTPRTCCQCRLLRSQSTFQEDLLIDTGSKWLSSWTQCQPLWMLLQHRHQLHCSWGHWLHRPASRTVPASYQHRQLVPSFKDLACGRSWHHHQQPEHLERDDPHHHLATSAFWPPQRKHHAFHSHRTASETRVPSVSAASVARCGHHYRLRLHLWRRQPSSWARHPLW